MKGVNSTVKQLYFIRATESQRIKIGVSRDPEHRLKDLQVGCPEPLQLYYSIPADIFTERETHAFFNDYRLGGEWFTGEEEMIDKINKYVGIYYDAMAKRDGTWEKRQADKLARENAREYHREISRKSQENKELLQRMKEYYGCSA